MALDKKIRENLDGKYIKIYSDCFLEGLEYASEIKINQVQFIGVSQTEVDFKAFEKLGDCLRILSFIGANDNIKNFASIYLLQKIEKIYFQEKQKFKIDISKFPQIQHLGAEYWKGLIGFDTAQSLTSIVLTKFTGTNLEQLSQLSRLKIMHIYSSKIRNMEGIELLPIEVISLSRNNSLENIKAISKLTALKELNIEKCKQVIEDEFLKDLGKKIKVNVIK